MLVSLTLADGRGDVLVRVEHVESLRADWGRDGKATVVRYASGAEDSVKGAVADVASVLGFKGSVA